MRAQGDRATVEGTSHRQGIVPSTLPTSSASEGAGSEVKGLCRLKCTGLHSPVTSSRSCIRHDSGSRPHERQSWANGLRMWVRLSPEKASGSRRNVVFCPFADPPGRESGHIGHRGSGLSRRSVRTHRPSVLRCDPTKAIKNVLPGPPSGDPKQDMEAGQTCCASRPSGSRSRPSSVGRKDASRVSFRLPGDFHPVQDRPAASGSAASRARRSGRACAASNPDGSTA
jgi:hypothetical protein